MKVSWKLALLGLAFVVVRPAIAQNFPDKPVTIIAGDTAGGSLDTLVRILSNQLALLWGVPVLVENAPGASGLIAYQRLAKAPPDGYTLLAASSASIATVQAFNPSLPYDLANNFTPVAMVFSTPMVLAVNSSLGVNSVADLVALSKKKPNGIFYSVPGPPILLWGEYFKSAAGVSASPVNYKGPAPSALALAAGEVQYTLDSPASLDPHVQSGKVKVIAVATPKRIPSLPSIPTLTELGIKGMERSFPRGIFGPPGLPGAIAKKLSDDFRTVSENPAIRVKLKPLGLEPDFRGPQAYAQYIREDKKFYGDTIKMHNLKNPLNK